MEKKQKIGKLDLEKLQGEVVSNKLMKCWKKNISSKLVRYDFSYPYDSEIYKRIAKTYIGEEERVITRKVNKNIKIDYIHTLSWHELQLLRAGCDRFTAMVNLYNKFASKNNIKQIINIDLLKKRIVTLNELEYYEEAKYIESFLIEYSSDSSDQLNSLKKMKVNKDNFPDQNENIKSADNLKKRVFEIAEECSITSSNVIKKAQKLGIKLKSPQSTVSYKEAVDITMYILTDKSDKLKTIIKKKVKNISNEIKIDSQSNSTDKDYYKELSNIENITYDKIFRYCKTLISDGIYDRRHKFFVEFAKMYKAFIYDAMEQIYDELDNKSLTLIDWGCKQGIGTLLVLDYIREKQLSINIDQIILIDDNNKLLSRSVVHAKSLNSKIEIYAINFKEQDDSNIIKVKNNITLNLLINDIFPIDYVDFNKFPTSQTIIIAISPENEYFIKKIYAYLTTECELIKNISSRDDKIGKYRRHEKIFSIKNKGEK